MSNAIERWFEHRNLNPFSDSFDRLFNEMATLRKNGALKMGESFSPSCEVGEDANHYVLKFDLPGVTKDQVQVEVDGDQLIVRAERQEEKKSEGKKKYFSEINYGSYIRSFALPAAMDEKKIDAKFENGVLTVTVPKTEAPQTKQIPVQ